MLENDAATRELPMLRKSAETLRHSLSLFAQNRFADPLKAFPSEIPPERKHKS
jgi:hypothetical protein